MNLRENIKQNRQPIKIYVDMGGVLFPSSSNDEVQRGTNEKPKSVKGFQSWVVNTKRDNQILGRYGVDGKWGKNTSNAWVKYGEEYKRSYPNSTTQSASQSNFIGANLWNNIKQYNPTILSSVGTTNVQQKIKNKINQVNNVLGLPSDKAIFVTSGRDKSRYANGNILIDDSNDNIKNWINAGGFGILYQNDQSTLDELNRILNKTNLQESIRRVLREEISKSKFFHRRIDLDEVNKLLPINSLQVFYETKSYEQFKYELTLRAVESIMYNEYGIGWEDLPEQEEISFVTEVSNMFEDKIMSLYNYYNKR
jgi:hypothetical protein